VYSLLCIEYTTHVLMYAYEKKLHDTAQEHIAYSTGQLVHWNLQYWGDPVDWLTQYVWMLVCDLAIKKMVKIGLSLSDEMQRIKFHNL